MPRCTRRGCGKDFSDINDTIDRCYYHSGAPVFHEGLKSWSCCATINKPVLDFDEFMSIPGCIEADRHTIESLKPDTPRVSSAGLTAQKTTDGKETYTTNTFKTMAAPTTPPEIVPVIEEDDPGIAVPQGTQCRRNGCKALFVSDELSRFGNGEEAVCIYHSAPPIFREGSKGYLCCKRRVLEFDEFLKIEGCKSGRHVFAPHKSKQAAEEMVNSRIDHYQTVDQVHVSVYARQVDKQRSRVKFDETEIILDLFLPDSKRCFRVLKLFGPIDPHRSTFQILNAKVELHLRKKDTRGWVLLEKTDRDLGNISLTFGVSGRTGTVGAKTIVVDESNKARVED